LDTRDKIVPVDQLAAKLGEGEWLAVIGKFDPLTLGQAERLAQAGSEGTAILAVVEPAAECLLPQEARAILVAALKSVQMVVVAEADAVAKFPRVQIARDDDGDRQRSLAFVEHVRGRQSGR
jgi:bifunctional ADP-heptose synthase (sugar kinase/adenylyltransferase)